MDVILTGLASALTVSNLLLIAFGVFVGIVVGAIPGLNGPMAIAIAIPLTFVLTPVAAISFLVGINKGANFGGAISAILMNVPGAAEAIATTFDGYPLARKGKPLKALKMALYASVVGDSFSDLVLILVAAPFAILALTMGPAELAALMLFALTFIAAVVGKSMMKGLIAGALGIFCSTIGLDPEASTPRMTFDVLELEEGIPLLAMVIGMLALSEIMIQIEERMHARADGEDTGINAFNKTTPREDRIVTMVEFRASFKTMMRSAMIGTVIGAIPGLGSTLAGFLGYGAAKRASKHPEEFGKGALDGIAGAEAANSATVGANLIPTLALGIPGNLSAAILISALIIHGLTPGPLIFEQHGSVLYGLFGAMLVANFFNLFIGQAGLRMFAWVLSLPNQFIHPVVVLLCFSGAYLTTQSMFAVALMVGFAILGYIMRKLDFSIVAYIIAFILGPLFEDTLRQTLVLFEDNPEQLLTRPIAVAFVVLTGYSIYRLGFRKKPEMLSGG
ncbi:MAG: putative tricarboxylic transport membrane protein [Alphaproteobacteria bacterium]|jgi:putative tricarboxylic transport membrane protein